VAGGVIPSGTQCGVGPERLGVDVGRYGGKLRKHPELIFAGRLALALGVLDPFEMLERMPARAWRFWQAYEVLEPWRVGDELARTGPLPPPAMVREKMIAIFKTAKMAQGAT